jgi:hypothetical protein
MHSPRWSILVAVIGALVAVALAIWSTGLLIDALANAPAALSGALLVPLAGGVGWLVNRIAARSDAAAIAHRDKKIAIYSKFVAAVLYDFTPAELRQASVKEPPDLVQEMASFQREILFWGSPKVIRAYTAFRENPNDPRVTAKHLNSLFSAMRSDIGLSNFGLGQHDFMRLFIKDPKEYDDWIAGRK